MSRVAAAPSRRPTGVTRTKNACGSGRRTNRPLPVRTTISPADRSSTRSLSPAVIPRWWQVARTMLRRMWSTRTSSPTEAPARLGGSSRGLESRSLRSRTLVTMPASPGGCLLSGPEADRNRGAIQAQDEGPLRFQPEKGRTRPPHAECRGCARSTGPRPGRVRMPHPDRSRDSLSQKTLSLRLEPRPLLGLEGQQRECRSLVEGIGAGYDVVLLEGPVAAGRDRSPRPGTRVLPCDLLDSRSHPEPRLWPFTASSFRGPTIPPRGTRLRSRTNIERSRTELRPGCSPP